MCCSLFNRSDKATKCMHVNMGRWWMATERAGLLTALYHSRSSPQFNKRHSFTLASMYTYRSIPMTKTATHKTQANVQGAKLQRDIISSWQALSRALQLEDRISINSGHLSKNAWKGTLSLCYQPNQLMSTAGPPFFFQCLWMWLLRFIMFPQNMCSLCLPFSPSAPRSRLNGLLGAEFSLFWALSLNYLIYFSNLSYLVLFPW